MERGCIKKYLQFKFRKQIHVNFYSLRMVLVRPFYIFETETGIGIGHMHVYTRTIFSHPMTEIMPIHLHVKKKK